jgi:regulator of protease activity HflC (stomatin/prohibitin superfamily)
VFPADKPLIFDRVAHVVSEECSTSTLREIFIEKFSELDDRIADSLRSTLRVWAPGVEIIAVRATKPTIPTEVRANFEQVQVERTKLGIAQQRQRVLEVEAQTKKLVAEIQARTTAAVANISMAKQLLEQEGQQRISAINNDITRARATAEADAEHYRVLKLAEADEKRLTPAFLQLTQIQALANASKVYFGDKLPNMYIDRPTIAN